ncbi:phage tail tip lysozyme [Streptococcus suis]|nr:phage tail tip lysozyme [Streptococcus suis]MDW8589121.1 phage tail tip lysozyme [Streptococcus suis]MDW8614853.1 phage tail tip lysozyme [Streptococcus suis]
MNQRFEKWTISRNHEQPVKTIRYLKLETQHELKPKVRVAPSQSQSQHIGTTKSVGKINKVTTWVKERTEYQEVVQERTQEQLASTTQAKPQRAVRTSRYQKQVAKGEYKLAQKNYRLAKSSKDLQLLQASKERLQAARIDYVVAKKVHKGTIKRSGGGKLTKLGQSSYQSGRKGAESVFSEDETLGDIAASRQQMRQIHASVDQGKKMARYSQKVVVDAGKNAYGLANRTYNLARGQGFTRTPVANRWETRLKQATERMKRRLTRGQMKKAKKASQSSVTALKKVVKTVTNLVTNPLRAQTYFIGFGLILVISLFSAGASTTVQQDEFDLNDSWLHLSKRDREKSSEKVDYWTNIDDIIFYMNFRYGSEWSPGSSWNEGFGGKLTGFLGFNKYSDALNDIWNHLNDDTANLQQVSDVVGVDSDLEWAKLSDEEWKAYQEQIELTDEVGRYPSYLELENPFYSEDEELSAEPLLVLKRYGYETSDTIYQKSQLKANTGQRLLAPLAGTVTVTGDDLEIATADARFTFVDVAGIRYQTGDTVVPGDEVGSVSTAGFQEISYQKLQRADSEKEADTWTYVNPGFYFASVKYNQTTSVLSDLELSGDMATRVRQAYEYIKKYEPKATLKGAAAMFGNFWTESMLTAKRAEGDYLNPPIGASDSSWDDPNWLSMNGPTIYQGRYPNILRRGLGLGQWTDTGDGAIRHSLLLAYAQSKGKKWYDLELQIDFIFNGDSPYYRETARQILTSEDDLDSLTQRFLVEWEGNSGDKLLERQNNAKQILAFLSTPAGGTGIAAASWDFPEAYRSRVPNPPSTASLTTQQGSGYPVGQCTWYAYNRLVELGSITDLSGAYGYLGDGQNWVQSLVAKGWKRSAVPVVGAVVSTAGGFDGTPAAYGHVAIVEAVNPDGTFLVSECNIRGVQDKVHFSVKSPAAFYSFAVPR